MNYRELQRFAVRAWAFLCAALLFSACASTQKREWNDRIGHYTFDQAMQQMGPPVSSATLEDGGMIAEWFLKPGPHLSVALSSGFEGSNSAISAGQGVDIPTPGHYLRLTFDGNHTLRDWQEVRH